MHVFGGYTPECDLVNRLGPAILERCYEAATVMQGFTSGNFTVFIVESDVVLRNLMMTFLVREHHRVLEARNPPEARRLCYAVEGTVDLLIAGHTIETRKGRQIAERMRRSWPSLKILQLSNLPFDRLQKQGFAIPDSEYLQKPFSLLDFGQTINRILAGNNKVFSSGASLAGSLPN